MRRGCGTREAGGIYLTVGMGPFGSPVEEFIVDYPVPVDAGELGISPLGMHLISGNGEYYLMDWVGEAHYPSPADFVEEVRKHGLSRKISPTFDFAKLRGTVTHMLIHPKAVLLNADAWTHQQPHKCPKGLHTPADGACACHWWTAGRVPTDVPRPEDDTPGRVHWETRSKGLADGFNNYYEFRYFEDLPPMERGLGIFMAFPIVGIEVIAHDDDKLVAERVERARKAGVGVTVWDE